MRRTAASVAGAAVVLTTLGGMALDRNRTLDAFVGLPRLGGRAPAEAGLYLRVRHGEGAAAVARRMQDQGWVRSAWWIRFEAWRGGWGGRLTPGLYPYQPKERVRGLLTRLVRGQIAEARFTIPEGWQLPRILAALADSAMVPLDSLEAAARDASWLAQSEVPGPGLEGYLFPETYRIPKGDSPYRIFDQMLRPGRALWRDSLETAALAVGLDRRRLWTLASMIESEAALTEERARIAAVFWNRLRLGVRLESDPTVLYAQGRPPGRLLLVDLEVDSPYNTYRYPGLPPGPICTPGLASLRAALQPQRACPDLFFVARGDGSHVFSRSIADHNRARARLRHASAAQGRAR